MLDAVHTAACFNLWIFALSFGNAQREWVNKNGLDVQVLATWQKEIDTLWHSMHW